MSLVNATSNPRHRLNINVIEIENGYVVAYSGGEDFEYRYVQYFEPTAEEAADRLELILSNK